MHKVSLVGGIRWWFVLVCDQQSAAGSVLGALLLVIYITDLDENLVDMIGKIADYTKMSGQLDSEECCLRLQQYRDQLGT